MIPFVNVTIYAENHGSAQTYQEISKENLRIFCNINSSSEICSLYGKPHLTKVLATLFSKQTRPHSSLHNHDENYLRNIILIIVERL